MIILTHLSPDLVGCAVYMVLSRNIVRLLLGLSLMTTAVNLVLFQTGEPFVAAAFVPRVTSPRRRRPGAAGADPHGDRDRWR